MRGSGSVPVDGACRMCREAGADGKRLSMEGYEAADGDIFRDFMLG